MAKKDIKIKNMLTFQTLGNVSINQKILCRSFFCLIAITKLETKAPPENKFVFLSKNQAFWLIDFILPSPLKLLFFTPLPIVQWSGVTDPS